ncbi:MAG: energy-coupling factor transporter ATPase [Clostridia bacterium]|nr:energy-coupling factor transporter ATPase [Clostridia bacterium]
MAFIKTENLSFAYDDDLSHAALKNINIEINEGEFVAILGHNGSGKSTLAKQLNGILLPTEGRVTVDGMDTADDEALIKIRRTAGMVFQNPDNQIVASIVEEDVAFAPENLGIDPLEIRKRVDEALETVGMTKYKNHSAHMLSGGQKQRVAIAGLLAMKPKCIILDEPTAMLDPKGRKEVMKTIKKLNSEENITIVLITHYMDEAAKAKRVIVMNKGEVMLDDTPHYVFQNAGLLKSIGLDVPQSTELMFELRKQDIKVPLAVISDDECVTVLKEILEEDRVTD